MNHAGEKKVHVLPATPETVHTGFYDQSLPPVLTIHSGDTVLFETMHLYDDRVEKGLTFKKLGKLKLKAQQLSQRKGDLICELVGERVKIAGKAKTYLIGDIYL